MDIEQANLEAEINAIRAALAKMESRLDVLHQEFQRTATTVQRIKLAQDGVTTLGLRREETLSELQAQLNRIERLLGGPAE